MALQQAQPSSPSPEAGSCIAQRYIVEASLGTGGMAEVFRVRDSSNGSVVALKRLSQELIDRRPVAAVLFEREYHTLKQLEHPSIVRVYDYGISEYGPYYTMELLDGEDLMQIAPLPWKQACALLRDVASSLAIVHSRRLLHRDVSPRNVRRGPDGRAKLIDFGAMASLGSAGEMIGTPPCVPPEAMHGQPLDARADLYALGAVAYWTLTGTHAYSARTLGGLRDAWRSRPRAPSARVKDVPEALDRLVLTLLSLDPLARPGSAAEVIEHLTVIAGLDPDEHVEVARAYLSAPTLLGREDEVLRFRKQLLRCGRGRGGVAIVEAAPGMGRSRLLHAVELEGKLAGALVLRAKGATDRDHGVLQALCRELLATLPDVALAVARPHAEVLAHVLPELRERIAPLELAKIDGPDELETRVEAAACAWLLALAKRQSLVIAVDDLHCADASSLSLLALLAQHAPEQRLALVLSIAEGQSASAPLALATLRRKATVVTLGPLSAEHTMALACAVFGDVPNVARVADWMHRLARGNPRTCMELCSHLVERDIARYEQGGWLLPATLPEHELPTSLEHTLERRLAGLSELARELAAGLALSDVALLLEEYALLLDDGAAAGNRLFTALDELVGAGVLVTRNEAYAFSQGGYIEAARRAIGPERETVLHRRLAKLFVRREDLARQAAHLLHAGDEIEALQALAEHHRDTGAYLSPEPPKLSAERRRAISIGSMENTTAAVETRKRLLDACVRHDWPERERLMIRNGLVMLANQYNPSLMRGHVEQQLDRLRIDSGAIYWDRFADISPQRERALRCVQHAQSVYDATPETERVLPPKEAIGALAMTIGAIQTLCRQSHDLALLERALELADYASHVAASLRAFHTTTLHALELVRGRFDIAANIRREAMAYYDQAFASGVPVQPVTRVGRVITCMVEGFERARLGDDAAFVQAEQLDGPLFPNNDIVSLGPHIWHRRAWEIRRVFHLYRGDAADARRCQDQLDRLSTRHAYAPYGGGASFFEAQAFAMSGDLMGLKQSIEAIALIVEKQYPGWTPFLQVATGDYHRLRDEPERALQAYDRALAQIAAGAHAAWTPAAAARVEALLALGRHAEALAAARQALAQCQQAELGLVAELELERVLALCEARDGQTAVAAERLERAIALMTERGIRGVRVGALYEARARVALAAADSDGFAAFAARTAEVYRAGRNPALVAKYERLIESARTTDVALSNELTHAAEISAALGLSQQGQSFHTVFAECEDGGARRARALRLLLDRRGAQGGFLYSADGAGRIALQAAEPAGEPPPELAAALQQYLQAELDDSRDVTVTCFDGGATSSSLGPASAYQPVLLWSMEEGERVIVGIAALHCQQEHFTMPSWDLLAAVSKILVDQDEEVVSMIG